MIECSLNRLSRASRSLAFIVLLLSASPARALPFGEVAVTIEDEPRGESQHGYKEIWFRIDNKSENKTHEIKLTLPRSADIDYGDTLRSVTRTVTVEPGKSVRVWLAYPEHFSLAGSEMGVTVDGNEQKNTLSVGTVSTGSHYSTRYFAYSSRKDNSPLVLCGKSIDARFVGASQHYSELFSNPIRTPELAEITRSVKTGAVTIPGGPGCSPMKVNLFSAAPPIQFVSATVPPSSWSSNWLGYTRYDGIVVTAEESRAMTPEVREAIGQYVECGGCLAIMGEGGALPGNWKLVAVDNFPMKAGPAGMGFCIVVTHKDYFGGNPGVLGTLHALWAQTLSPWQVNRTAIEANKGFPVIDDVGIPVRGLLTLMFVFAIVIGPVNLIVLTRKKRRLWLFWTVPVISLFTCVLVLGYMVLAEGWEFKRRVESFTVLDENSRRASTLGCLGVYASLLPGSGLHFSQQTEVSYQNDDDSSSMGYRRRRKGSPLTMDWTRDQHLISGWMTPRVPSHFLLRKSELRRERVTIAPGSQGSPEALNGLGAPIAELWYMDESGTVFSTTAIPAGGRATLSPVAKPIVPSDGHSLRTVYLRSYLDMVERTKRDGVALLTPRTYLAVVEGTPFLDDGATSSPSAKSRSAVFGIMKEGSDGG